MNPRDSLTNSSKEDDYRKKFIRGVYFTIGTLFLIFGGIGIFLPILPTTPFLLVSAACFYKNSQRMHHWMLYNRWFGEYLKNYVEGKGISLKAKLFTISLLWVLIIYSIFMVINNLFLQLILFAIAVGVSIHLIKLATLRERTRKEID